MLLLASKVELALPPADPKHCLLYGKKLSREPYIAPQDLANLWADLKSGSIQFLGSKVCWQSDAVDEAGDDLE